jgi:hypothetical protein
MIKPTKVVLPSAQPTRIDTVNDEGSRDDVQGIVFYNVGPGIVEIVLNGGAYGSGYPVAVGDTSPPLTIAYTEAMYVIPSVNNTEIRILEAGV